MAFSWGELSAWHLSRYWTDGSPPLSAQRSGSASLSRPRSIPTRRRPSSIKTDPAAIPHGYMTYFTWPSSSQVCTAVPKVQKALVKSAPCSSQSCRYVSDASLGPGFRTLPMRRYDDDECVLLEGGRNNAGADKSCRGSRPTADPAPP